MRAYLSSVVLAVLLLLGATGSARAHANLEKSTPNANAVLIDQPRQAFLWFSEEPELRLTELQLYDPTGRALGTLAVRPAPGDPRAITANLPDLAPGTYLIGWRTTSTVDGHTTRGAFPFTFGAGQIPQSVSAAGMSGVSLYSPVPSAVVARALTFTGALGLVGALAFGPLVLWPALATVPGGRRRREEVEAPLELAARRAQRWVGLFSVPALIIGTGLLALSFAAEAAEVGLLAAAGEPFGRALGGTRHGYLFGTRLLLAVLLGVLLPFVGRSRIIHWVALAAATALLLTISLGSHAAAAPRLMPLLVAVDMAHLLAGGAWIGGLVQLCFVAALTAGGRAALLAGVVARFGVMTWAVALVVVTGMVQSSVHVGSPGALVGTPYGQTLIVKLALVAGMAGLGYHHWRRIGPRLGAAVAGLAERFRWSAMAEAGLGVLVLLATGLLTAHQPARDAAVALRHVSARASAGDLAFDLKIAPGEAGLNRTELAVAGPLGSVEKAVLRLSHLDMDMGEQEVELRTERPGLYVIEGGQFSMPGRWRVEPLVRRTGRDDARAELALTVGEPLGSELEDAPPFELTPRMVVGIQVVLFGLIVLIGSSRLRRRRPSLGTPALLLALVTIAGGGYVTVAAVMAAQAAPQRQRNPIQMDAAAYARGRMLYQQHCLSCHGIGGRGDGPLGRSLNPRPADLRIHVMDHPEGQLYGWITDGVPGTAMPGFRDVVPADDRWRLVGFIRGFGDGAPAPARTAVAELSRPAPGGPGAAPAPLERILARPVPASVGVTAASAVVAGTTVTVRVSPDRYARGLQQQVEVERASPRAGEVRYRFTMAGHEMPVDEGVLPVRPAARFDMVGDWRLDLDLDGRTVTYWLTVDQEGRIAFAEP